MFRFQIFEIKQTVQTILLIKILNLQDVRPFSELISIDERIKYKKSCKRASKTT